MLHMETVESDTLDLVKRIQALPVLSETRLVGGTALALQLGHRLSIDLDFFGTWQDRNLQPALESCGAVIRTGGSGRLQFYEIDKVKVDFVTYECPWLRNPVVEDEIRMAHIEDIAAMKLEAVTSRGKKKDFMDIAFLLDQFDIRRMLDLYQKKYPSGLMLLVLRSLVYFDDAEDDPMPMMLKPLDWETTKERIRQAVRQVALEG
ncbi:MAG: nucleotidyl transferase AbiEii/AbiGii toxin family protein [Proteiniphilum sp.]|nr:nucleotidyl transferase AbiEii/AbiGii toxin family protein [Proteiniphilum sp.]